jgi:hypothetical protein
MLTVSTGMCMHHSAMNGVTQFIKNLLPYHWLVSQLLLSNGYIPYNMNPKGKEVDYEKKEEMEKEEEDNTV